MWELNAKEGKLVDGCYTNLLRRVQNISRRQHFTLSQVHGDLSRFLLPSPSVDLSSPDKHFVSRVKLSLAS